jgi:hypothetical protein
MVVVLNMQRKPLGIRPHAREGEIDLHPMISGLRIRGELTL